MAAEAVENVLLEHGAVSPVMDSAAFAFLTSSAGTAWNRACSYFSLVNSGSDE